MNEPVDHPVWSDERIESLLREFFRHEMPAELRETRDAPVAVAAPSPPVRTAPRRRAGFVGLVTAATAVAAVWLVLMLQAPVSDEYSGDGSESESRASVAEEGDDASPDLERLDQPGVRPPVELRSRGEIEHVDATEPGLEIEYPEWEADIRIYGTEEQQKSKAGDRN